MAKHKGKRKETRRLELGAPLSVFINERVTFETAAGRWVEPDGHISSYCVVISQQRHKGPLRNGGLFRMAIEPGAVDGVAEALHRWGIAAELGRLDYLFGGPATS